MTQGVKFEISTGRILANLSASQSQFLAQASSGEAMLVHEEVESDALRYVDTSDANNPVVIDRPANPTTADKVSIAADGAELLKLSGIPSGSTVMVRGPVASDTDVDDGTLELSTDTPGAYTVTVDSFPEQRKELTFDAT